MSEQNLTSAELQAMRKLLMFEVSEAAEYVGKCTPRSWQRWESGRTPPPQEVAERLHRLVEKRNGVIKGITNKWRLDTQGAFNERLKLKYYPTLEQHRQDFPHEDAAHWRLYQSAVAALMAENKDIELL